MATDKFNFNDRDTREGLDKFSDKFEHLGEISSSEGSETERSLSGQLILLTTVLITVNMLVIGQDGSLLSRLTHLEKELVFCALVFEVIATFSGIVNYLRIEYFYNVWGSVLYECSRIVTRRKYTTRRGLTRSINKEVDEVPSRNFRFALWLQIGSIVVTLIIYLALLHGLLFYIAPHHK